MKTILIVDDEFAIRELLALLLRDQGYGVLMAPHGAQALEFLCQEPVDLVVSDVMMPVMDGRALIDAMAADDTLSAIPFVFITAVPRRVERSRAAAVLAKPFNSTHLLEVIRDVIGGPQDGP